MIKNHLNSYQVQHRKRVPTSRIHCNCQRRFVLNILIWIVVSSISLIWSLHFITTSDRAWFCFFFFIFNFWGLPLPQHIPASIHRYPELIFPPSYFPIFTKLFLTYPSTFVSVFPTVFYCWIFILGPLSFRSLYMPT